VKLEIRVVSYPGCRFEALEPPQLGTLQAIPSDMSKELLLTADQAALVTEATPAPKAVALTFSDADADALMALPLAEAKRLVAAEFERQYLVRVMESAKSVSEGARQTGLDRTNFRRLLQRHGLH
jgi:transcriptional regulator with GAF, ATPase, and Fis domain